MSAGGGAARLLTPKTSENKLPNWSRDGKWIYFTSTRTGRPEVWRMPWTGGDGEQVTQNGGSLVVESVDRKTLYYTKSESSPLYARALEGGEEREVVPWIETRAFAPVEDGIYYIGAKTERGTYPLAFRTMSGQASRTLAEIDGLITFGLSVAPDRKTIIFAKGTTIGVDLAMVENFR